MPAEHNAFIDSIREDLSAPLPVFPMDPGELFEGLDRVTGRGMPLEEVTRYSGTLGAPDPHLFKDETTGLYYTSASGKGGALRRSRDLIHWEYIGSAMKDDIPPEAREWVYYSDKYPLGGLWASEVHVVNGKFRMYYSTSTWGHRLSYIGMAESDTAEGPYIDKGAIVKTTEASPVNAIDASFVMDAETGEQYMNFGSFWGGIRQIQLDPETGLRLENGQPYLGRSIWVRHHRADRAIEGSYEFYNPDTGYYYLMASYDSTRNDYNVRVSRSRCVSGPFVDHQGVMVNNTHTGVDPDAIGLKIADCYRFGSHPGWVCIGHNGVLRDNDRYFISFQALNQDYPNCKVQHVHQMFFDKDGWPLVNPCIYTGEFRQKIDPALMVGQWERILLNKPDGTSLTRNAAPMYLRDDGQCLVDGQMGQWRMTGEDELEMEICGVVERCYVIPSYDTDNKRPVLALTGRRDDGICTWGLKSMEGRA